MFLGLILTLFSVAASAQQASGESIRRHRIEEGYRNGELTRPEMRRLHRDHNRYKMEKRRDYRDGRISRHERRHLHRMHRHERRELHRYRHNHHYRA
ncbi:MAG: hypothetical protein ABUT20_14390 [Bacteroidota bacterium]